MKLLATLWLLILPLMFTAGPATAAHDDGLDDAWKLINDRNGIQVYMRHREDSRLKTFRGETRIRLPDEYSLSMALNDYPSFPRWLHFVDGASELHRESPLKRWLRFTTQLPWPLKDREAILEVDVLQRVTREEEAVYVVLSGAPDLLPENPRYVRFPEMQGEFTMVRLGNDEVMVRYELVLDPGGYIPAWLANILLRDAPYFTLERMRRILQEPKYQAQYLDYVELRGPGRPKHLLPPRSYIYGRPPAEPLEKVPFEGLNQARP